MYLEPGLLLSSLYSSLRMFEHLIIKRVITSSVAFIYKVYYRVGFRSQYMSGLLYGLNMQHVLGSSYLVTVE